MLLREYMSNIKKGHGGGGFTHTRGFSPSVCQYFTFLLLWGNVSNPESTPVARLTTSGCPSLEDAAPSSPVAPRTVIPRSCTSAPAKPKPSYSATTEGKTFSSLDKVTSDPNLCHRPSEEKNAEKAEGSGWRMRERYGRLAVQGRNAHRLSQFSPLSI